MRNLIQSTDLGEKNRAFCTVPLFAYIIFSSIVHLKTAELLLCGSDSSKHAAAEPTSFCAFPMSLFTVLSKKPGLTMHANQHLKTKKKKNRQNHIVKAKILIKVMSDLRECILSCRLFAS